ncbi:MAG TPA: hypothetical protein VMN39_05005 [Longimicrobiaceae bacterium]|nr:hypothetical protein [Longimicrobiaceae bacterium]
MTVEPRFFGGIDFSGAREPLSNLWTALGEGVGGRLRIVSLRPHAFRSDLAAYVAEGWRTSATEDGNALWGADFPFGLPLDVCGALGIKDSWDETLAWVADRPPDEVKKAAGEAIRSARLADAGALAPLDLRLYKQTVEGLRWLHELREDAAVAVYPQAPRGDADCLLIEVYPSATVRDLGLPRRRAPNRPGQLRARIAAFKPYLDFADPDVAAVAATLEDAWDATIACLTAYLCRDDLAQPQRLAPASLDRIAREGWIYRAPAALEPPSAS